MTVYTKEEAMSWFLSHSAGEVTCEKDGVQKTVDCYPDAEEFFTV